VFVVSYLFDLCLLRARCTSASWRKPLSGAAFPHSFTLGVPPPPKILRSIDAG
jgi:hypothetical protein